jgi:hypothetical protein
MSKKITEINVWGAFVDCFPGHTETYLSQDESKITDSQWLAMARLWRNALLNESDWSQVSDNALSEIQREQWRQYRQELRNITDSVSNPKDIVFPDMPS